MRNILKGISLIIVFFLCSCTKVDNYDEPNATFKGAILDGTTGESFLTETGGIQIELEELSWRENPTPQYIPSKMDGTFEDTQLFSGHYLVTPTNGPFWPVDGQELDINSNTTQNFELTPYLKITNLTHTLSGTTLTLKFNLEAPISQGLPTIIDVKPFVNITDFVGSGATINEYTDPNKIDINSEWSEAIAKTEYELEVTNLKHGRTFYVRVGARVNDSYKKYNYSEVIEIEVP